METIENPTPTPKQKFSLKTIGYFIWDLIKILAITLIIIVPFRTFVAEPFVVSGPSMEPTFHNRDYIILDRLSYYSSDPVRGQAVVFRPPQKPEEYFIKRVIGLPNETIQISKGQVYIFNNQNPKGFHLEEKYLTERLQTLPDIFQKIPENSYFVMGDNRMRSSDSRNWGLLPRENIVGKVWLTLYSQNKLKFDIFKTASY